jgi:hypothetical protein
MSACWLTIPLANGIFTVVQNSKNKILALVINSQGLWLLNSAKWLQILLHVTGEKSPLGSELQKQVVMVHRIFNLSTYISAVMYNVFSSLAKAQFDVAAGIFNRPNAFPFLSNIQTPPGPVANTFPLLSIFNPSAPPFSV